MPTSPTDDTTAQPDTEQTDEDDAAPLAEHIATALTTNQDTDQSDTDAQHLTRADHPTTVCINTTRLNFHHTDSDAAPTENTVSYATLSLVTNDTPLVLAATPLDATDPVEDDLSSVFDAVRAAVADTLAERADDSTDPEALLAAATVAACNAEQSARHADPLIESDNDSDPSATRSE